MPRSDALQRRSLQQGFTLLEVLVALTITGLALGVLFAVIAGNKRLAWSAEDSLQRTMQARSLLNLVQLYDDQGDVEFDQPEQALELTTDLDVEIPERQTTATLSALRGYEVRDADQVLYRGTYWVKQPLPEMPDGQAGSANQGAFGGLVDQRADAAGAPDLQDFVGDRRRPRDADGEPRQDASPGGGDNPQRGRRR